MTTTPLYDQALARSRDPHTSHAATAVAAKSTAREDVHRILTEHGPLHDRGIEILHTEYVQRILTEHGPLHDRGIEILHTEYVQRGFMAAKSGQRLRTARRELVDAGLVREHQDRGEALLVRMPSGWSSHVWEVAQ